LSVSTKIDTVDCIRPMVMNMSEYGKLWKQYTIEKRGQFVGSPLMNQVESVIRDKLKANVASVIGTEVVSSLKFIGIKKTCLLHVKNSKGIFVTVKSDSSPLNDKLILAAKIAFEK
jgi:hypothetical protein